MPHGRRQWLRAWLGAGAGVLLLRSAASPGETHDDRSAWSGERIMRESVSRNSRFPYVFEQYTLILTDRLGNRAVRRARRYSRVEDDGTFKLLLVFDDPESIRGVALLAVLQPGRPARSSIYLPAFGPSLKHPSGDAPGGEILGTDLAIADLVPEALAENRYAVTGERRIDDTWHFVIDAFPVDDEAERASGYGLRRHLVRKDTLVIVRTDCYDRRLRFVKRVSRHDLRQVQGDSWLPDVVLVENDKLQHSTLLKVVRRIYSRDYVPAHLFEPEWLLANRHLHDDALAPWQERTAPPAASPAAAPGGLGDA